jgi:hypothetical protein
MGYVDVEWCYYWKSSKWHGCYLFQDIPKSKIKITMLSVPPKLQAAFDEVASIKDMFIGSDGEEYPLNEFYYFDIDNGQMNFTDIATPQVKSYLKQIFDKHLL